MYQCLGLGTHESGGCGEDWYHPGCLVGLGPKWFEGTTGKKPSGNEDGGLPTISEDAEVPQNGAGTGAESKEDEDDDPPLPPGFPNEEDFEGFICYKCLDTYPWIKRYAGAPGFLPAASLNNRDQNIQTGGANEPTGSSKKRKASDEEEDSSAEPKRLRSEDPEANTIVTAHGSEDATKASEENPSTTTTACKYASLPPAPTGEFSLFFKENFRDNLCRCSSCYKNLNPHPQLLEEEEIYEPPLSDDGESQHGGSTHGSGSLLERGESALRNVDRVRAIEGVMAYNHLKEQLKPFFQQFAESGQAISAEDIKEYFAKLRGDDHAIKAAGQSATPKKDGDDDDLRREQSGY
jgi:E3 ubiquitin-protein ligase UBR7